MPTTGTSSRTTCSSVPTTPSPWSTSGWPPGTATRTRLHYGTPGYAPPQWIGPTPLDPVHWDLYAAGQVLYELLVGRPAFPPPRVSDAKVRMRAVMVLKAAKPFLDPGPDVPLEVRAVVRSLTAREPSVRIVEAADAVRRLKLLQAALVEA